MPHLRLTHDEVRDLKLALDVRLHALRIELRGTETRDYRAILRARLANLEIILARLDEDEESTDSSPPA